MTKKYQLDQKIFPRISAFLCQEGFDESPAVNVYEKGLITLIKLSKEKEMVALHSNLLEKSEGNGKVVVHHHCRRKFTDTRKKSSRGKPTKRLQSSVEIPGFDWKSSCFLFCEKKDENHVKRDTVITVQTLPIRQNLIERAKERNDDWGNQVLEKLLVCNDLVAEEAVYHVSCMNKFRLHTPRSEKTFKQKRLERYRDNIYFAQLPERENIIGFRNMTDQILSDLKKEEQQTKMDIIIAAAKLVKEDIREIEKTIDYYPTIDDITDEDRDNEWVPESLRTFLRILISSNLKNKSLGQCITQASRPRSIMCPLMFGLGIELEKSMACKWLVDHLSRLGFCISNDEVLRYKQSAIERSNAENRDDSPQFMQWVADNVDHNVTTLTGKDTLHGMGIISIIHCETIQVIVSFILTICLKGYLLIHCLLLFIVDLHIV